MNLSWEDEWHRRSYGILDEKRLQDRGALPREEGDVIREYNAMHEENFLTSWEDLVGKEERKKEEQNIREEVKKKGKREEEEQEGEKEENEVVWVKRRCVDFISSEASDIFSQGEELEGSGVSSGDSVDDPGDLLGCDFGTLMGGSVVPVMMDVLVSPSSVVTEFCDCSSLGSDWETVEPQSLSFSKKCLFVGTDFKEEMRYEGSPVKAPPLSS